MNKIKFTKEDGRIIKSYEAILESIGLFLGNYSEIALYSLEKSEGCLKKIINPIYTKRELNSSFTEQGLQIMNDYLKTKKHELSIYTTSSSKGEPMRSVFTVITNESKPIGLIDINFNMNIPLSEFISTFSLFQVPSQIQNENYDESSKDVGVLIHNAVNDIVLDISTDRTIPNHEKNKFIVYGLYKKGIFDIKGSVVMVAKELKLSKYTIYSYIRELKEKDGE